VKPAVPHFRIFVSSPQDELSVERRALKAAILGNPLLRRYVADVFLFEESPAKDRRPDDLYLDRLEQSDIYLGLFGRTYGTAGKSGVSATEREFDHATALGKTRLVFPYGDRDRRDPRMAALIAKAGRDLVYHPAADLATLTAEVYSALVDFLTEAGVLLHQPFDAQPCAKATLAALSPERMRWFLRQAREERGFPLSPGTAPATLLTRLNLLDARRPVHAAILLFCPAPHRFIPGAEIKCVRFPGTVVERPAPDYKVFRGDVFAQADEARDFVLAKLERARGTRGRQSAAAAAYEIPADAIFEAIVNALCHRDYTSHAAVEVRVFSDRVEVWNPGRLPSNLSIDLLAADHPSVPVNPLLADPLYQARYIDKLGTGIPMMFDRCRAAGLPPPDFGQRGASFVVTLWRDALTPEVLDRLDLLPRQREALLALKARGRLLVSEYRAFTGVSKPTASRDLDALVRLGLVARVGATGRGTHYVLHPQGLKKGSKGSKGSAGRLSPKGS
jgi:predicted HTH transcriptional regulator